MHTVHTLRLLPSSASLKHAWPRVPQPGSRGSAPASDRGTARCRRRFDADFGRDVRTGLPRCRPLTPSGKTQGRASTARSRGAPGSVSGRTGGWARVAPKEAGGPRPRRRPTCVESRTTTARKCCVHVTYVSSLIKRVRDME